jgi:hypothetical protein
MSLPNHQPDDHEPLYEPTFEEGMAILDGYTRRMLGISAEEFLRRYDAGEYRGIGEGDAVGRGVVRCEMLIPFARPSRLDERGRILRAE